MATLVSDRPPPALPVEHEPRALDAWPRTRRPMPWLIAIFVGMVYLLPVDSIFLPISLPFDSSLDRMVLALITAVWFVLSLVGRGANRPRFRHTPINVAVYVFVGFCCLSVALNLRDLFWDGEMRLAFKQLVLGLTYVLFFYLVASSLERRDLVAFAKLLVWLGAISAIGTVIQYRTGLNLFDKLAHVLPGMKVVAHSGVTAFRKLSAGPTLHGLADATLLDAVIPFALVFLVHAKSTADRCGWGVAICLVLAGCFSTGEKTSLILVVIAVAITVLYRPRRYLPYWPGVVLAVLAVTVISPHVFSELRYQFSVAGSSSSTSGRTSDYSAVAPFIATHLLFGRGFGSFDPQKYRILDDQMLGYLIQIGGLGVLAFAAMLLTPVVLVHRMARRGVELSSDLMIGVVAGSLTYLVSNFLYDAASMRQGPYVFFLLAGFASVATGWRSRAGPLGRLGDTREDGG